ncbi:hypothetical protein PCANC_27236 [Puccinia coronata f. sp. avenae]|uniref:Uncharacterized protein n=1 Tax=Puccinia coronata f. sp. avenae TaxID=200324 RepID=A0A2N5RYR0_9BASI|nr:hypothetical protein PCANC_27236 [Puccinia coronata f. sp. avenae]
MRLNLRREHSAEQETNDPLATSDYIQVYHHQEGREEGEQEQEQEQEREQRAEEDDDPFQNISTPGSPLNSDHDPTHLALNQDQPHLDLDLSTVNSDQTSITSLFSFPDPLNSIDQIITNNHPDHYYSNRWSSSQSTGELSPQSELITATTISSDQLDSLTSNSSDINETDLLSHPPSPRFQTAGSHLSHRLQVYICGHHQPSHSQSLEILSNLRINFTPLDIQLNSNPRLNHPFKSTQLNPNTNRFRRAISRALSDNQPNPTRPINPDILYHTSWLEIISNDLTHLSDLQQRSFLSSSPKQPALIIHITHSPHCFPTDWLNQLHLTCPTDHLDLFKVLPVILDQSKSNLQSIIETIQRICNGLKSSYPVEPTSATTDQPPSTNEKVVDVRSLLLQQQQHDTPDLVDHLLRPNDFAIMPAPSVAKLYQLLVPHEPSAHNKPHPPAPPGGSKFLAVLACLAVTIMAAVTLIPQVLVHQPPLTAMAAGDSYSPTEWANVTPLEASAHPLSITLSPTPLPLDKNSTVNLPAIFSAEKSQSVKYGPALKMSRVDRLKDNVRRVEISDDHQKSGTHGAIRNEPRSELPPDSTPESRWKVQWRKKKAAGDHIMKRVWSEYDKLHTLYDEKKPLFILSSSTSSLSPDITSPLHVKMWARKLAPRLRKGLYNLRTEPVLCAAHLARRTSIPHYLFHI